jgi:hypothetical protein
MERQALENERAIKRWNDPKQTSIREARIAALDTSTPPNINNLEQNIDNPVINNVESNTSLPIDQNNQESNVRPPDQPYNDILIPENNQESNVRPPDQPRNDVLIPENNQPENIPEAVPLGPITIPENEVSVVNDENSVQQADQAIRPNNNNNEPPQSQQPPPPQNEDNDQPDYSLKNKFLKLLNNDLEKSNEIDSNIDRNINPIQNAMFEENKNYDEYESKPVISFQSPNIQINNMKPNEKIPSSESGVVYDDKALGYLIFNGKKILDFMPEMFNMREVL